VFLITLVAPWYRNLSKRLTKSPKVFMTDTALLMNLLDIKDLDSHHMKGAILENFVASELQKHLLIHTEYKLFHFRTHDDKDVDFLIERNDGKLIGIEVKYSMTASLNDFKGLKALQDLVGDDFKCGIVLYQGREILDFGPNLYAMPLECLWQGFVS
jgi:predicted AAA+ superfamily ATPase